MSSLSSLVKNGALLELLSMRSFEFPSNTSFQHYRRKEKQKKKEKKEEKWKMKKNRRKMKEDKKRSKKIEQGIKQK